MSWRLEEGPFVCYNLRMQTYLDCYPCILRQSIEAVRMAGGTSAQERAVVQKVLETLKNIPDSATPPAIGMKVHQLVREITANPDPYASVKKAGTEKALSLLPELTALVAESEDRLETALRLSIAGNIIDFGPHPQYDLWNEIERVLVQEPAINDLPILRECLETADSILLLGDNAGETVFDRILIEALPKPVTYVVRGGPILNDAAYEDAIAAGIETVAEVIDTGARVPGVYLSLCSDAFRQRFEAAQLILAKGMGNYESLSEVAAPIFFLLQVKCPVVARDLDAEVGSIIIKQGDQFRVSESYRV